MNDQDRASCRVPLCVDVENDWGDRPTTRAVDEILPRLLDLLDLHGSRATFFVVGRLAGRVRDVIPRDGRHEVGSHGLTHRRLDRLGAAERAHEIATSRAELEAAGFSVRGFRAPFLARTEDLPALLRASGYEYDASAGALVPGLRARRAAGAGPVAALVPGTLRDGLTPCNLTWLRLLHPVGSWLWPTRPRSFSLHLHELLDGPGGMHGWPAPLRALHARRSGAGAWRILAGLLARGVCFGTCHESIGSGSGARR